MTKLEEMAKAAYEADGDAGVRKPPWAMLSSRGVVHPIRKRYLDMQAAVLKVLREPTQAMVDAAYDGPNPVEPREGTDCWQAMIDAVLKEAP